MRRARVVKEPPAAAFERRQPSRDTGPLVCPLCQSPRIRRVARLTDALACVCEACSTEFIITPQRGDA